MMRRTVRSGSFWLCLILNLLLNLEWSIPAIAALVLHYWLGISIWWFIGGLGLWLLRVLAGMWLMGWAAACSREKPPQRENKNPYSAKTEDYLKRK